MNDPACYRAPLDAYPGMNRFVLDWLRGDERFLKRGATARNTQRSVPSFLVDALVESNRRWGLDVEDEIRRWAAGGTETIVAGQQVGFAGGPLYTITKLAAMLKIKRDNEARGIPTTVFFWLATEDHDFDEVANIALPDEDPKRQRDLVCLKAGRLQQNRQPVGAQAIPETLITDFVKVLGIARPSWLRPGITFGDSFAELIAETAGGFVLVDSLLPQLRRAGTPLVERLLSRWSDVQSAIEKRSEALQQAGYTPQVVPRPDDGYTLLFRIDPKTGERDLVHKPSEADALESLSTSALTRPLLQDFVLQPDVFVGGPAEIAYFAQIEPLHEMLDVPMPRVALRAHVLVARRSTLQKIAKYDIRPEEVFTTPEELLSTREPRGVAEVRSITEAAERELAGHIDKIRDLALPADHAVARSVNRSIGHINYHFRKLTERAVRALVRKDRERFAAVRDAVSTLFPDQQVQDRIVAWVPFWVHEGRPFIERLVNEVEPDTATFKIMGV